MGGIFGSIGKEDCVMDLFFGTDYHSHLGTKRGGLCILQKNGFNRNIHNIENAPFRSKFEGDLETMEGRAGIGSISDTDPQPLTFRNHLGFWALATVGRINNKEELVEELLSSGQGHFSAMSENQINNTELVASIISKGKNFVEGITMAQNKIEGSITMILLSHEGIYAARDRYGRTPLIIGKKDDAYCAASESFAFINIGYEFKRELGPGEIAFLTADEEVTVKPPYEKQRICTFLWTYFGYTTSMYEGNNVEVMRHRNGALMAEAEEDNLDVDYIAGVPDSGTAHALGYANKIKIPYARPLIKYTPTWPRSFMPQMQRARNLIAKMKLVPVFQIIRNKSFVLIDDSIVRGTQLSETVEYLTSNGAKNIHVRSACPPIMYGCKYLNFSRSVNEMELITRRVIKKLENLGEGEEISKELLEIYTDSSTKKHAEMVEEIRKQMGFDSLKFQELDKLLEATGVEPCKLCTYCWNGVE